MAASGFDRENILGRKLTKMDRQELCAFISDLCRTVVAEALPDAIIVMLTVSADD